MYKLNIHKYKIMYECMYITCTYAKAELKSIRWGMMAKLRTSQNILGIARSQKVKFPTEYVNGGTEDVYFLVIDLFLLKYLKF